MIKILKWLPVFGLIFIFLFLRFYNIKNSLFFFNDMGRDLLVLLEMIQNKKLILLGPQTSALPINQSPLYYYLIFPIYLISGQSFLSANLTLAFIYLSLFLFNLYQYRHHQTYICSLLISFFLLSIHPQYILQGRFVWNPSFLTPFLITAILSFFQLLQKFNYRYLLISTISLAVSLSLSYSIAPITIAILIFCLFSNQKIFVKYIICFFSFLSFINLPVIVYQMKKLIISGTFISSNQINQISHNYFDKIDAFKNYVLASGNPIIDNFLLIGLIILTVFSFRSKNNLSKYLASLLIITLLITILSPFNLQAHYIFALTTCIFLLIGSLNLKNSFLIILLLTILYLSPQKLTAYFQSSPRTYREMNTCFQKYCQQHPENTYVSVQSNLYPYHYGPEHRYLMKLNSCHVKHIETENNQANFMAVVLDSSTFSDQTKYYELDLFGKHKQISTFNCLPNLQIVTLEKI